VTSTLYQLQHITLQDDAHNSFSLSLTRNHSVLIQTNDAYVANPQMNLHDSDSNCSVIINTL